MTEPVIVKHSFVIACVALMQVILPPIVAVATLYGMLLAFHLNFDRGMQLLAGLAVLLTLLVSVRRRNPNAPIFSGTLQLAAGAVGRSGLVLAILLAIGFSA